MPDSVPLEALRNGLWYNSKFKEDLSLRPSTNLEDALHRSQNYIFLEEDKDFYAEKHGVKRSFPFAEDDSPENHWDVTEMPSQSAPSTPSRLRSTTPRMTSAIILCTVASTEELVILSTPARNSSVTSWSSTRRKTFRWKTSPTFMDLYELAKFLASRRTATRPRSGQAAPQPRCNQLQSARRYQLGTRDCQSPRRDEKKSFTRRIAAIPLRDQTALRLQFYNKGDDPRNWLRNFEMAMRRQKYASPEEQDANYCQVFIEHMNKDATSWFSNLPAETIDNFDDLSTAFMKHFGMFMSKGSTNLFTMAQGKDESLRKSHLGTHHLVKIHKRRPLRSLSQQDSDESKWCKLHGRADHTTEECRHVMSLIQEYSNTPQSQSMLNAAMKIDELQTSADVKIRRQDEGDDAEKNAPASLPHQDDLPPPPPVPDVEAPVTTAALTAAMQGFTAQIASQFAQMQAQQQKYNDTKPSHPSMAETSSPACRHLQTHQQLKLVTETLTDDVSNASTACKAKIPKKRNSSDVLAQRSDALKHSNPWTDHPQKTRARTSHGSKPYGREKTAVSSRVSDLKVTPSRHSHSPLSKNFLQLTRFPSASRRKLAKLVLSPPSRQAYHRVQQLSISTYLCGTRTGGLQSQTKLGEDENPIIHPVEVENGRVNTNNGRVNPLLVPGEEAPVTNAATTAPMQDFAVRIAATQAPHHQRRTSYPYWTNPFPDDDKKYHGNRL
ncbi:unnamed protein product [Microthlaspi erraticum]|uniref:Retrotransposon gag domain-containing protein n=1 Tax=Microthlaspi erraticum TaxID=1685480 RepID=A0A6D2J1M5_9BRAS|nr:unnamed protein product [Microthlaspi erraticum]